MSTLLAVLLNEAGIPKPNVPSSTRKKIEANHNKKKRFELIYCAYVLIITKNRLPLTRYTQDAQLTILATHFGGNLDSATRRAN